jgi:predicted nucleic acid-binding protein
LKTNVLLDTDIVIFLLKKEQSFVQRFLNLVKQGYEFYYNPVVSAEIYAGAFEKEIPQIESFFIKLQCIEICKFTGIQAGNYANVYKKAYNKISLEDYLIAANAKVNSMKLWTNNKKHYPMEDIELVE